CAVARYRQVIDGERGRRGEACQGLPPVGFGGGHVLLLQPGDVIAVGARRRKLEGLAPGEGLVIGENFFQEQRQRPPVEQDVVVRPYECISVVSGVQQRHSHERGLCQVETPAALLV